MNYCTYKKNSYYIILYRRRGKIRWAKYSAIEVFAEIFSRCLCHKYSLFSINKVKHLYSRKNFCGTSENHEKRRSLAQRIFPRLRYLLTKYFVIKQSLDTDDCTIRGY